MRYKYWLVSGADASADGGDFGFLIRCPNGIGKTAVTSLALSFMRSKHRDDLADSFGQDFRDNVREVQPIEFNECHILYNDLEDSSD